MAGKPVVVVGAGPAGARAAIRLVEAGLRPIVIDEGRVSGGQIYRRQPANFLRRGEQVYGFEARKAAALHGEFDALLAAVDYRSESLVWGLYDGALHVLRGERTEIIQYGALILAAGATDRIMPVRGWTLPGVYSLGGAQIALKSQACAIGAHPAFLGTGPLLYLVAYQYAKVGARPVAILDTSPFKQRLGALPDLMARPSTLAKGLYYRSWLAATGVPVLTGISPLSIQGEGSVTGVRIRDRHGGELQFQCDAVGLGYGLRSETQLADLARCKFAFDAIARQWLPEADGDGRTSAPGVYVAGDGARIQGADAAELAGRLAACAVLSDLGHGVRPAEMPKLRRRLEAMQRFRLGLEKAFSWPAHLAAELADDTVICRCEVITAGELRRAARELGALEVNRAKAFSRVGMGRCQGRYCGLAAAEMLAAALKVPVEQVGRLRGQAPVKPVAIATVKAP
ncbi:MAG: FAD-dependent oxidoreductase [Proteobacteria bacterium]|nr:FAD-dependent oxidoreductase [Pseudomonadota bacterium]